MHSLVLLSSPGGRGQIKQKKKTVPQKVTIAKIPRAKKKYVTRVCGMATFGEFVDESDPDMYIVYGHTIPGSATSKRWPISMLAGEA